MPKTIAIKMFLALLIFSQPQCVGLAQVWTKLPWALWGNYYGVNYQSLPESGSSRTFSFDPERCLVAIVVGPYVFTTVDSAKTFKALKLPVHRTFYGTIRAVVADSKTIYVESRDINNLSWMVVSSDRGQSWDTVPDQGSVILRGSAFSIRHASGLNLVLYTHPWVLISTDRGQTWVDSLLVEPANRIMPPVDMASPTVLYCIDTSGIKEWSWQNQQWTDAPVSSATVWYRYFGSRHILAQEQSESVNLRLRRSTDKGATWRTIDTIRFVNSDTVIIPDVLHLVRADEGELSATCRLRSGAVFSTTDAGDTWILRGLSLNSNKYGDVENELSTLEGVSTIFPQNQPYYCIIPWGSELPLRRQYNVPYGNPFQFSDSLLLLANSVALYKTTDAGRSWFILNDEFSGYSGEFRNDEPDLQQYTAKSLWWGSNDSLYSRAQFDYYHPSTEFTGELSVPMTQFLRYDAIGSRPQRWYYAGFTWYDPHLPINESNTLQPSSASPSSLLIQIYPDQIEYYYSGSIFIKPEEGAPIIEYVRSGTHYAWQVRSGEVLLMADSLLISADTGRTWRSLPSVGLPLDSAGNIATVTSFCEGPNGEWYMGLSGAVYVDSLETELHHEPGGVVRSRDRGQTWEPLYGFPEPTHVFHVACDGQGVVYASATSRMYGAFRSKVRREQDFMSQLYRINTDTAELAFSEYHSGPPSKATRVLRRDQRGAMLYASKFEGLQRSTDGGISWQHVGDGLLDTMTILDLVVASDNRLYVGTTIGVYDTDVLTTSVDNGSEDASRRTTVWCYPTPVNTTLRIRLNNMDLVKGSSPRLTLCTIRGEEVLNLTPEAVRSTGIQRTEFDVDVSTLPRGTYALVLQAGKNSSYYKVLVAH